MLRFESDKWQLAGLGSLFALCIVWQLPHVISLRYLLIVLLTALYLPAALRRFRTVSPDSGPRLLLLVFTAFLLWLLAVAIVISPEPAQSLREIKSEWLPATLCLLAGLGAGAMSAGSGSARDGAALRAVFWGLVFHAVLQLGYTAWMLALNGHLPSRFGGISDHRANVTYTNGLAVAILLADRIASSSAKSSLLRLGVRAQSGIFALLFVSTLASGTRNGAAVFLGMSLLGGLVFAARFRRANPRRWWLVLAVCVAAVALGSAIALKSDPRWQRFLATVPVAWDVDSNRAWVNTKVHPLPQAADGGEIDKSAYERIAYLRVAGRLLSEHPLGTEISRDAFRKLLEREHPGMRTNHAHNSYLDLALSAGFPGLGLWLAFLGAMAWYGTRAYLRRRDACGLALVFVVGAFAMRSVLDSIIRDHTIEEFLLCVGVLAGCIGGTPAGKGASA